jgi:hypothetical protein
VGRHIQLYDYRAATYDKLENESAALADARHMIKAFERDPRVSRSTITRFTCQAELSRCTPCEVLR